MELYDKDGTLVEGALTKEEIETAQKTAVDAAAAKALEDYKKEHPEPLAETDEEKIAREKKEKEEAEKKETEKTPQQIVEEAVTVALKKRDVQDMAKKFAPGDPDKQKEILANIDRVTGFEDTPEGMVQQAEAAARMAGIDTAGVNVSDVSATGSGRNIDVADAKKTSEIDESLQKGLGISKEDVEKYGKEADGIRDSMNNK